VALVGAYYWNTTHWSIKACEDVTHLERYYDEAGRAPPAERASKVVRKPPPACCVSRRGGARMGLTTNRRKSLCPKAKAS
jgi:hypothetical protein